MHSLSWYGASIFTFWKERFIRAQRDTIRLSLFGTIRALTESHLELIGFVIYFTWSAYCITHSPVYALNGYFLGLTFIALRILPHVERNHFFSLLPFLFLYSLPLFIVTYMGTLSFLNSAPISLRFFYFTLLSSIYCLLIPLFWAWFKTPPQLFRFPLHYFARVPFLWVTTAPFTLFYCIFLFLIYFSLKKFTTGGVVIIGLSTPLFIAFLMPIFWQALGMYRELNALRQD